MPQVIITPFPALRARLAEDKYNALAGGLEQGANLLGQGLLQYAQIKSEERQKKIAVMSALGAKYGFAHFGPNFAAEYDRLLGGNIFPRDNLGNVIVPESHEEIMRQHIAKIRQDALDKGDMNTVREIDLVDAGFMKPVPSPTEQQMYRDRADATARMHQLDRESREKIAGITAAAHIKAAQISADKPQKYDPNEASSGMGLFKGRVYPMAKLMNRQTGEIKEGARPIPLGEWKLRESIPALRLASEERVARTHKLEIEAQNDLMTKGPALTVIRAAMAAKNPDVANKLLSAYIHTAGKSAGMSDAEISEVLATPNVFKRFKTFLFGSANEIDRANIESSGATPEPTPKESPGRRKLSTGVEVLEIEQPEVADPIAPQRQRITGMTAADIEKRVGRVTDVRKRAMAKGLIARLKELEQMASLFPGGASTNPADVAEASSIRERLTDILKGR